jgi:hypothetical protein
MNNWNMQSFLRSYGSGDQVSRVSHTIIVFKLMRNKSVDIILVCATRFWNKRHQRSLKRLYTEGLL